MIGARLPGGVAELIPGYLGHQRWFAGDSAPDPRDVSVVAADELAVTAGGAHRLLWAIVAVQAVSPGLPAVQYQLVIGERPHGEVAEFLNGHEAGVLGSAGDRYYYDAAYDAEMARSLLDVITGGAEVAERVRPITAEQSNTSLVFDNRLIAKIFRRLPDAANPDIEVTEALARAGFGHVAAPVAVWRRNGLDLAFVQEFLVGGSEGWALALTSLRDLYSARPADPADAGGDFAAEAGRLGTMTAEMHLALAEVYGVDREAFGSVGWPEVLDAIDVRLRRLPGAAPSGSGHAVLDQLRLVAGPGPAIRVHGDYHLGQVMRTDSGWYVLDFEGEPVRPLAERQVPTSPFKDVTGMLRSFQYAANFALQDREAHETAELAVLAEQWEARNREAFLDGYLSTPGVAGLLPESSATRAAVSLAFELDKALYELDYERAYRPDWVHIPEAAIQRLLAGSSGGREG